MVLLFTLLFFGVPIAFAMGAVGIISTWFLMGSFTSMGIVRMAVFDTGTDYFFSVIPLFTITGFLCFGAGIVKALYEAAYTWFGFLKGGLSIASIFACAGFAAISGDSMATAAAMGSVALPEMKRFGYDDKLSTGSVAAGGTLGILIPPSMGFIIYGVITEQSVGKLFMAGVIPGILLAVLFSLLVFIRVQINPRLGPPGPKTPFSVKLASLRYLWPILSLFTIVLGGLYVGLFTPTEAGGISVAGSLILLLIGKDRSLQKIVDALRESAKMTTMIFAMLIGVNILAYFIGLSEIPLRLSAFIVSLGASKYLVLILIGILFLILGMVMNIIPMIVLTLPILFPSVVALGFDPIWFGVFVVIMIQIGQLTPPVGINCFVINAVAQDVSLADIFRGVTPFVLVQVFLLVILTIWPDIALVIPNSMETLAELSK
jgi:tripartite ATP-independent transporter DctM subunit